MTFEPFKDWKGTLKLLLLDLLLVWSQLFIKISAKNGKYFAHMMTKCTKSKQINIKNSKEITPHLIWLTLPYAKSVIISQKICKF